MSKQILASKITDIELVESFRQGNENEVIGYLYEEHKKAFQSVADRFYGVDDATVQSTILEQIWVALQDYDVERGTKLTTFICTYIKSALRTLTQGYNTYKRKVNQSNNCQLFSAYETEDNSRPFETADIEHGYSRTEMLSLIDSLDLTDNQYKYCQCLIDQVCDSSMASIASYLGLSRAGVLGIKKSLQDKLSFLMQ